MSKRVKQTSPLGGWVLLVITTILIYVLNCHIVSLPAIGRLVDPVNGCWANAEPVSKDFTATYKFPVSADANIWFDERMVPHIRAGNDHDLFFLEGYVHAYFRLWQMDMETRAAAGRISEVVGDKAFNFDRMQRRKGMVYAAENSLRAMEAEPHTKVMMDAYTEGINNYIASLNFRAYPLEYKLIGFKPEKWTNLKTSLLLKYMADDLTGKTDDIALTYLRGVLPKVEFDLLFPERIAGASPAIPEGTVFDKPSLTTPVAPPDSVAFPRFKSTDFGEKREDGKGSNNWALSGSRTASGAAILCNDPHLGLNLPSLWYEMQLQTPDMNVYGASLPGAPGIIIGFNDSLTWGFTNNYRDVKDFYLIKPVKENKNKYWFAGKQLDFSKRIERIGIKGKNDFIDTVNYTIHGPVMYDDNYHSKDGLNKMLAVCWMAHRATNELFAVYGMNKAKNYDQFVDAILNFQCPAQNIAYADRQGNIALWGQGQFVNLWKGQGRFVMNGADSSTLWKELIPMRENPHVLNPARGFVSSANQETTDSTYPYWYNNGGFVNLRAWRMNQLLSGMQKATVEDMFAMQNETYSILAEKTLPLMLKYLPDTFQVKKWNDVANVLRNWTYYLSAENEAATFYQVWWSFFFRDVWAPVLSTRTPDNLFPLQERTMQLLEADIDPARHARVEGYYADVVRTSFKETMDSIYKLEKTIGTEWYNVKNTSIIHLAKIPAFSYNHLKIGGWGNAINAAKGDHGPSWRMVVQMGKEIEAYGVYPGGQSGNPGSKYYATFLDHWVDGKYYRLQFLPNTDKQTNKDLKYTWTIEK